MANTPQGHNCDLLPRKSLPLRFKSLPDEASPSPASRQRNDSCDAYARFIDEAHSPARCCSISSNIPLCVESLEVDGSPCSWWRGCCSGSSDTIRGNPTRRITL